MMRMSHWCILSVSYIGTLGLFLGFLLLKSSTPYHRIKIVRRCVLAQLDFYPEETLPLVYIGELQYQRNACNKAFLTIKSTFIYMI